MELKLLLSGIILSTLVGTAQADPHKSPAILSSISSSNIVTINSTDAKKVRGEYFDTRAARDDFCRNHKDKCDAKGYSITKGKHFAKDRRKWRPDVTYTH